VSGVALGSLLVLAACGGGGGDAETTGMTDGSTEYGSTTGSVTEVPTEGSAATELTSGGEVLPPGCDVLVSPGDAADLQPALFAATEGTTVCMGEGVFMLATELAIPTKAVTLQGAGREATILDFSAQELGDGAVKITADGVTVTGFTVREAPGEGVRAQGVGGVVFAAIAVEWATPMGDTNGAHGLQTVACEDVEIRDARVIGARAAGIHVGQSTQVLVEDSEVDGNVVGVEVENSTGVVVRNNQVHDNAAGILIANLPGLEVKGGERTLVYGNQVEDNNGVNFAEPGSFVASVPVGVGVMLVATDANEVRDNTIGGNDTTGLVVVSYSEVLFGPTGEDPGFDAFSQGNYVHGNTFADNGGAPGPLAAIFGDPGPDMADDGCLDPEVQPAPALVNCFDMNGAASYLNFDLCGGGMNPSGDLGPVTCQHMPLPDL